MKEAVLEVAIYNVFFCPLSSYCIIFSLPLSQFGEVQPAKAHVDRSVSLTQLVDSNSLAGKLIKIELHLSSLPISIFDMRCILRILLHARISVPCIIIVIIVYISQIKEVFHSFSRIRCHFECKG